MDAWPLTRQNFLEPYAQDIVPAAGCSGHRQALEALWQDTYPGDTYITGGIGQSYMHEGFTRAWHKSNLAAYRPVWRCQ